MRNGRQGSVVARTPRCAKVPHTHTHTQHNTCTYSTRAHSQPPRRHDDGDDDGDDAPGRDCDAVGARVQWPVAHSALQPCSVGFVHALWVRERLGHVHRHADLLDAQVGVRRNDRPPRKVDALAWCTQGAVVRTNTTHARPMHERRVRLSSQGGPPRSELRWYHRAPTSTANAPCHNTQTRDANTVSRTQEVASEAPLLALQPLAHAALGLLGPRRSGQARQLAVHEGGHQHL